MKTLTKKAIVTYAPVEQLLDKLMEEYTCDQLDILKSGNGNLDLSALYQELVEFKSKRGGLAPFETDSVALQLAIEKYLSNDK